MVTRGRGVFCNELKINLIRYNSLSKTEDEVSVNSRIINHLQNTRQGGIRRRKVRGIKAGGLHTGAVDDKGDHDGGGVTYQAADGEREQAGGIHTGTADGE